MLKIGQKIPEVNLTVFHKNKIKQISTTNLKGKWIILVFYPADFTFICPTELGRFADLYTEFKERNTEIISISTDTVYVHKVWHDTSPSIKKIKYPMAADSSAEISKLFGTYLEEDGVTTRATFIIDPEGVIRIIELHDNDIGRNVDEILRKLDAAIHVRINPGEVCPENWSSGLPTILKNLNRVGKI